jgi:hypothetical protein
MDQCCFLPKLENNINKKKSTKNPATKVLEPESACIASCRRNKLTNKKTNELIHPRDGL